MSFRQFNAVGEFSFFSTFTVYRIHYKYKMYNIMLYLRYVFIFVLRNNYTGRDYHPGPVHRSPLVVIIIVIIVVVLIGDQWSFVVVCDISTRSDIIGTPFSHYHHPFHPQLDGTRCVVRPGYCFSCVSYEILRGAVSEMNDDVDDDDDNTTMMIYPAENRVQRHCRLSYSICTLHARLARYAII